MTPLVSRSAAIALVAVAALAVWSFALGPLWGEYADLQNSHSDYLTRIASQTEIQRRAVDYKNMLDNLSVDDTTRRIYAQQSQSAAEALFQNDVHAIVVSSGVVVNSLQVLQARNSGSTKRLMMRVDVIGNNQQLATLLGALRSYEKTLTISKASVRILKDEDTSTPASLSIVLEVQAFSHG